MKSKYSDPSNPRRILEIRDAVAIPIIANGDIKSPASIHRLLESTRADGAMIGRAALDNPYIFGSNPVILKKTTQLSKSWRLVLDYWGTGIQHQVPVDFSQAKHFLYMHTKDGQLKKHLRIQLEAINSMEEFLSRIVATDPDLSLHPVVGELANG